MAAAAAAAAQTLHSSSSSSSSSSLSRPPVFSLSFNRCTTLQTRGLNRQPYFSQTLYLKWDLSLRHQKVTWRSSSTVNVKCNLESSSTEDILPPKRVITNVSLRVFPSTAIKIGLLTVVSITFLQTAAALAATHSIGKSSLGLKVATFLRGSGWADEVVVAVIAMLPVLELRGAIPVGYWMGIPPLITYVLSVFGNMLPIPVVFLYFEQLLEFVASRSARAKWLVNKIFESTRQKAGPIQEFQWLGLMLFVAVPFPGTGAWSGGMAASILGMNFWDAMSANFVGVLLAGILVNILVTVGTREAVFMGIAMFVISTFMWRILHFLQQKGNHEA
ncbi:unnamed protein product [Sphagnum jensenii]|uniref:Small multi-drug export protein n=1 Tax=Sphagnum jensenii TaxID=128206 RepID=A0ABP0VM72_9BRYO